ncbi:MAG: DUF523 domain-containing protein [Pseudomonadales bacterium]|nr:DUF523 domain-containing protein [Pseudomonadales bacterium]
MNRILISACLIGEKVRYDGKIRADIPKQISVWIDQGIVVPVCPEVGGGMSIPRNPSEICGGDGCDVLSENATVVNTEGKEVTALFLKGAEVALRLCRKHNIKVAVLTESSPSCGSGTIYDGEFSGNKILGVGVTTALLRKNGIKVYSQHQLELANQELIQGS